MGKEAQRLIGLSCVNFSTDGVAFVHVVSTSDFHPEVIHCDFISASGPKQQLAMLKKYIKKHRLVGTNCACVLNPDDYRLLLMDAPPVPPEEAKQALRFLIKDLIDFPLEKAAIDTFEIPMHKGKQKVYAVASHLKLLERNTRLIEQAGLTPCYIDIAELALLHLLVLWKGMQTSVVCLFEHAGAVHIVIVYDNYICLAREVGKGFDFGWDKSIEKFEKLVEQIQQSFDYYQSQMEKEPPSVLVLLPGITISAERKAQLGERLSIPIESMDLISLFALKQPLDAEAQSRCLTVLAEGLKMGEILKHVEEPT